MHFFESYADCILQNHKGECEIKRIVLFLLVITILLSITACSGYNGLMREHLGNEDNYYANFYTEYN